MDEEVIKKLTEVDRKINELSVNSQMDVSDIRMLQSLRERLDKKMADFKADIDRKTVSFEATMKSEVDSLFNKINQVKPK